MTGIATWPRGCSKPTCGASTRAQTHRMPEPGRSAAVLDLLDRLGPEIVVVDVDILGSYRRDHAAFAGVGERSMVPSVRTEDVDIDDDDLGAESVQEIEYGCRASWLRHPVGLRSCRSPTRGLRAASWPGRDPRHRGRRVWLRAQRSGPGAHLPDPAGPRARRGGARRWCRAMRS